MGTNALVTAAAFLVGDAEVVVQLDIKPGWHVYWENPGILVWRQRFLGSIR